MSDILILAEPYKRKIGNVTFIISSFTNPNTTKTPQELILQMLESHVNNFEKRST